MVCTEPLGLCPAEVNNVEMLWLGCFIPVDKTCGLSAPAEKKQGNLNQMDGEREASWRGRLPCHLPHPTGGSRRSPLGSPHLALWRRVRSGEEETTPPVARGSERVPSTKLI